MKLSSIILGFPNNENCPKTLKLFCNKANLGFDDATEQIPVQTVDITQGPGISNLVTIHLQANKWNRTDSITIFVEDNYGGDVSEIHSCKIFGTPLMGTDVAAIKNLDKH